MDVSERRSYAPPAKEVASGHLIPTECCVLERSHALRPFLFPPLSNAIVGLAVVVTRSTKHAFILLDFVLPVLSFLLAYALGLLVLKRSRWAVAFAILAATKYMFSAEDYLPRLDNLHAAVAHLRLSQPSSWWQLLVDTFPFLSTAGGIDPRAYPSATRLYAPMLTNVFLLGALLACAYASRRFWNSRFWVLAGVLCGLNLYIYPHTGVLLLFVFGVVLALSVVFARLPAKRCVPPITAAFLTALPFLLNYYLLTRAPWYVDYLSRLGLYDPPAPRFPMPLWVHWLTLWGLTCVTAVCDRWLRRDACQRGHSHCDALMWAFPPALLLTISIPTLANSGILLSKYANYSIPIPEMLLILWIIATWATLLADRLHRWKGARWGGRILASVFILSILCAHVCHALHNSLNVYRVDDYHLWTTHYREPESKIAVDYINEHYGEDTVVLTVSPSINYDLLAFSRVRVFLPFFFCTTAANAEIDARTLVAAKSLGLKTPLYEAYPDELRFMLYGWRFGRMAAGPDAGRREELVRRYEVMPVSLDDALEGRQLDVLLTRKKDAFGLDERVFDAGAIQGNGFVKVFAGGGVTIYERGIVDGDDKPAGGGCRVRGPQEHP